MIILLLLVVISILPAIQSFGLQYNDIKLYSKTNDRIPILKQIGSVGTYEEYINSREDKPYFIQQISDTLKRTDTPLVIVFVELDLVYELTDELALYNETLGFVGYNSIIYEVSGVDAEDLKDIIKNYWQSGYNVTGAVLIGDLPAEWFHHENDFYGPSEFPCDLFFMDLDGTWTDTDDDKMYDSHTEGSGDTAPEIYVGRIDASNIPGDEITILKKYFAKVNNFWTGNTNQTEYGLTYTDQDWAGYVDFRYDLQYAYQNYEAIWYPNVDKDDYVNNRIPSTYEFIQLSCHSSSEGHVFSTGGWVYNDEIRIAPPQALFYNLFCCSSLRFTDYNCLGYAYILDTDTPSLTVVGSAKTGSMLDFRYFYGPIGNGSSFGTAFRKWFEYEYPYGDESGGYNDISWFYGMTILGDPTIIIKKHKPPFGKNFTGPNIGLNGEEYDFCIDAFDSENDDIHCIFDWGDNSDSGWLGPFVSEDTICASHIWNNPGEYLIRFKLKDTSGYESIWSNPIVITIYENTPPEKPTIDGPNRGKPETSYNYSFSSIDPKGLDIAEYIVDWDDGSGEVTISGPFASGEEIISNHSWTAQKKYIIKARAVDVFGAESIWAEFKVTIPRNKSYANNLNLVNWLFELFPILEKLLSIVSIHL
jgi:hypothetical protein